MDEALSLWMSSLSVAMADPKVAFTLEWTREVVEARGWRYEVATEPSAVELGNVRFLRLEAARKKLVIRSPDPNDVGTHTGCRSGEVRRIQHRGDKVVERALVVAVGCTAIVIGGLTGCSSDKSASEVPVPQPRPRRQR